MFKTAFAATLAVVIEATQLQTKTGDLELAQTASKWGYGAEESENSTELAQVEHRGVIDKEESEGDACERDGGEWDGEECQYDLAQISLGLA